MYGGLYPRDFLLRLRHCPELIRRCSCQSHSDLPRTQEASKSSKHRPPLSSTPYYHGLYRLSRIAIASATKVPVNKAPAPHLPGAPATHGIPAPEAPLSFGQVEPYPHTLPHFSFPSPPPIVRGHRISNLALPRTREVVVSGISSFTGSLSNNPYRSDERGPE